MESIRHSRSTRETHLPASEILQKRFVQKAHALASLKNRSGKRGCQLLFIRRITRSSPLPPVGPTTLQLGHGSLRIGVGVGVGVGVGDDGGDVGVGVGVGVAVGVGLGVALGNGVAV